MSTPPSASPLPLDDPYDRPSMSLSNRAGRALWGVVWTLFGRTSPRPLHAWRAGLLRLFGARLGPRCRIYPGAVIWAPWNLVCEDHVAIANGAVIYNSLPMHLGSHATVSQDAYLCGATHDFDVAEFPMISKPISVGAYAWVCARATVMPGVQVAEGAVLGLGSIAARNLDAWTVYAGHPARPIRQRRRFL